MYLNKNISEAQMLATMDEAIITINIEGVIQGWNPGATKLYGYSADEVIGKSLKILFPKEGINEFNFVLSEIGKNNFTRYLETHRQHKSGKLLEISVTYSPISVDGKVIGACIIARDISFWKNCQLQALHYERLACAAQEANKLKSQFIANVSHELRTPLNGIIGFAELMYDDYVDPKSEKYKEFIANILSCAKQLLLLLNDVLDLTKIQAGKMQFHPEPLSINKITKEIKDIFLKPTTEKNITLKIEIGKNLGHIVTDTDKLKQILYNYISNALKFSSINSEVIVRFSREKKDMFRIEVEDTGIGIKEADLKNLFVEFHQIDSSASKYYQGTGLGLALTRNLVEAQGGYVGVSSTFGKGSLFYACLPCFPKSHLPITAKNSSYETLKPAKKRLKQILIIEPESFERMLLIDNLRQLGFKVKVANDLSEAINAFKNYKLDAIVLNMAFQPLTHWESIQQVVLYLNSGSQPNALLATIDVTQTMNNNIKIVDYILKTAQSNELLSTVMAGMNYIDPNEKNKTILIVDNDEMAIKRASNALDEFGFDVIACQSSGSALAALMEHRPSVILLDPFLAHQSGLALLYKLRQLERGRNTPIIIWTNTILTEETKLRLKANLDRLVLSSFDRQENLLLLLNKKLQAQKTSEEETA